MDITYCSKELIRERRREEVKGEGRGERRREEEEGRKKKERRKGWEELTVECG